MQDAAPRHEATHAATAKRRSQTIPSARRREVAARHHLDTRTLDRAIDEGLEAVRAGMTRDRAAASLAELGL